MTYAEWVEIERQIEEVMQPAMEKKSRSGML